MTTMNRLKEYTRHIALTILIYIGGILPMQAITRIYGVVTDSLTREAMPYVSVYMQNTTAGCQTDKTGNFSFVTPETKGTLVVSFVGYSEQHIPIGEAVINENGEMALRVKKPKGPEIRPYTLRSNITPMRRTYLLLKAGTLAAHRRDCLVLLGSPPDTFHNFRLRKTHLSTQQNTTQTIKAQPSKKE